MYAYVIIRRCGPPVYPIDRLTSTHTQKCGARSAAPVSDQGFGSPGLANNTDRLTEIFPLEFPSVKVSIGIRKPCGLPPIHRFDLTSFRITVPGRTGPRYAFRGYYIACTLAHAVQAQVRWLAEPMAASG